MGLIAGRYRLEDPSGTGPVGIPARDVVSGDPVTVLRRPVPADGLVRSRELERLRRYAGTRSPHLAGVRAVELCGDSIVVVCGPLDGRLLDPASPPPGLTAGGVRRIAVALLDALGALHLAGVAHGRVGPGAVVLSPAAGAPTVTLLPLPVPWPTGLSPSSQDDDRRQACSLLLDLLQRVPVAGTGEEALARDLAAALGEVGGIGGGPRSPWGSADEPAPEPVRADPPPAPLALSPLSLAPLVPRPGTVDPPGDPAREPVPRRPAARRRARVSRRTVLEVGGAVLAAAALLASVVGAAVLTSRAEPRRTQADPSATRPVAAAPSSTVPGSGSPSPSAGDVPTSLPALIDTLSARPDAGGRSGPALLDALRGVASGDDAVAQQSAMRLMSLVLDDDGVDPRYASASVAALAAGPVPGAAGAPPSCVSVVPAAPDPVLQRYAQQVLDRLPDWQSEGLPSASADRLRGLASPVAAAQGAPALTACPTG